MSVRSHQAWIVMSAALLIVAASSSHAVTIRVDHAGGGDYLTIQEGIDAATYGDTVLVLPGTYSERLAMGADKDGIVLTSRDGAASTIISQGGGVGPPLLEIEDVGPTTVVSGLTLDDNRAQRPEPGGGGISAVRSGVTIEDCVIQDCYASYQGGGILIFDPAGITIRDCTIQRNSAGEGAGMCIEGTGTVTVVDTEFVENSVSGWYTVGCAGISIADATATLTGNSFLRNENAFSPFGVALAVTSGASVTAESNAFVDNDGSSAVLYLRNSTLHSARSTISGNTASGACITLTQAPGHATPANDVALTESIIHGNHARLLDVLSNVLPEFTGNSVEPNGHIVIDVRAGAEAGTLDASHNWWGTADPAAIAELVLDCVDDPGVDSCVDFSDWCSDPSCAGQLTEVPEATQQETSWGRLKSLYR